MPCRVAIIGDQSYGKFPKDMVEEQIIMEYQYWTAYLSQYLPISGELSSNPDFVAYLSEQGESIGQQLTDFMMMTLPSPRVSYY